MAVPALKLGGAEALLAAWPEPAGEAGWARAARARAARRLAERGAPVRRDEYWKFTDPTGLTVAPAPPAAVMGLDEEPIFDGTDRLRLVFVDGVFAPELSDAGVMEGVEIRPLAEVLAMDITWARELFGVLEGRGQDAGGPAARLAQHRAGDRRAWRSASPAGRRGRSTSSIAAAAAEAEALVHHLIRLDPGADLTLLESGPAAARLNAVTEVEVGDGAAFHHVRTQGRDHERRAATALFARLGQESLLKSFTLTVNGRLTRNEHVVEFTGDDAVAHVAGACVGRRRLPPRRHRLRHPRRARPARAGRCSRRCCAGARPASSRARSW